MATFSALDEVGRVLVARLRDGIDPDPTAGIQVGAPPEDPTSITEGLRLTLLWVTPQPAHRNDPWERGADGRRLPPPLTLSVFFLLTAYGTSEEQPLRALELLGMALRVLHSEPTITLPAGTSEGAGEGNLGVILVPTEMETMERIYTPLGVRHRPWALLEVTPVQLAHTATAAPAPAIVLPGGLRLGGHPSGDLTVITPPRVVRVTPQRPGLGGRVRIDFSLGAGALGRVWIGGAALAPADVTVLAAGSSVLATLPVQVSAGQRAVRIQTGDNTVEPPDLPVQFSDTVDIEVLPDGSSWLDAPTVLTLSAAAAASFTGEGLTGADAVLFWPEGGAQSPGELLLVPAAPVGDTTVGFAAGAIVAAADAVHPVPSGLCRVVARIFVENVVGSDGVARPRYRYTSPVLLEITP